MQFLWPPVVGSALPVSCVKPAEYSRVRWNSSQVPQSGRFPDAVPDLPLLSCDDAPVAHRAQAERGARRHAFLRVRPLRLRYFGRHLARSVDAGLNRAFAGIAYGLPESAAEFFPEAARQRYIVHGYRNVFSHVRLDQGAGDCGNAQGDPDPNNRSCR
jgi:hypothetical protein